MSGKIASPGLRAAIDYGPLALFFAVNFLAPLDAVDRVIAASGVFVVATVAAMIVSRVKLGAISPMLWISGGLVVVFGALTMYFRDPRFLQIKPTIVYAMLAAILAFGLATRRPLLETLLGSAYPGLSQEGWRKLTRNWVIFFAAMAAANEIVWRTTSWDFWVGYKVWGAIPLTLVFAMANVPMLMRHGLRTQDAPKTVPPQE